MLVLSRKEDQSIIGNEKVEIKVLKIKGKTVRLGLDAPQEFRWRRGELRPNESVKGDTVIEVEVEPDDLGEFNAIDIEAALAAAISECGVHPRTFVTSFKEHLGI